MPNKTIESATAKSRAASAQEAKASVKRTTGRRPRVIALRETDDVVREQVGGFFNFVREHAIVGLAVGFVVGAQAQSVVKQLITSFVDPAVALFFGGAKLSARTFTLHFAGNHADFGWGAMVYVLLNLLIVLATVYAVIKIFNLDKLDKPKT